MSSVNCQLCLPFTVHVYVIGPSTNEHCQSVILFFCKCLLCCTLDSQVFLRTREILLVPGLSLSRHYTAISNRRHPVGHVILLFSAEKFICFSRQERRQIESLPFRELLFKVVRGSLSRKFLFYKLSILLHSQTACLSA